MVLSIALLGALKLIFPSSRPPNDTVLVEGFHSHRADYERLREMFVDDARIVRIAEWGVETRESPVARMPPEGGLSTDRFQQYLGLLKRAGAQSIYRNSQEIGISVWATGWGGNTRHIDVVWTEKEPPRKVAILDDFYRDSSRPKGVYRHLDGNWYLWADR